MLQEETKTDNNNQSYILDIYLPDSMTGTPSEWLFIRKYSKEALYGVAAQSAGQICGIDIKTMVKTEKGLKLTVECEDKSSDDAWMNNYMRMITGFLYEIPPERVESTAKYLQREYKNLHGRLTENSKAL